MPGEINPKMGGSNTQHKNSTFSLSQLVWGPAVATYSTNTNIGITSATSANLAIGDGAKAGFSDSTSFNCLSIGSNTQAGLATGISNCIAIGLFARANAINCISIGNSNVANTQSTLVGWSALASNIGSTAFGYNASASGISSTAIGINTVSGGNSSVVIGSGAIGNGAGSIAIGSGANARSSGNNVAIGTSTSAGGGGFGIECVVIGNGAYGDAARNVAIGSGVSASLATNSNNVVAIGYLASSTGTTATNSIALGYGAKTGLQNQFTFGYDVVIGTSTRTSFLRAANQTTTATQTNLFLDGIAATQSIVLQNNSMNYYKAVVTAKITGASDAGTWIIEGSIQRGANAAATASVGTPIVNVIGLTSGALTNNWSVTAAANTSTGGLDIKVTGQASTIDWFSLVELVELVY